MSCGMLLGAEVQRVNLFAFFLMDIGMIAMID
jgi:hypothetical protein